MNPDAERPTVLVVDDTPDNLRLIGALLKDLYKVKAANGGEAALKIATSGTPPDLILLDIMMPEMDGFEVCRRLKADQATCGIPVIFLTALDDDESEAKGLALGAVDFITKPIHATGLVLRVQLHMELMLSRRRLEEKQKHLDRELQAARRLQMGLLPSAATMESLRARFGIRMEGMVEPSSMIGGDVWGCSAIDDSRLAVYVFDVSGHGIAAALNSFRIHTLIESLGELRTDPARMLETLCITLRQLLPRGQYATMFYGIIDTARSLLTWAGAAAPYPLLVTGGEGTSIDSSGTPIALGNGGGYENLEAPFPPGASLFLYSDGLTEAERPDGEMFGDDSMHQLVLGTVNGGLDLPALHKTFMDQVRQPLDDDLTLVLLRRQG